MASKYPILLIFFILLITVQQSCSRRKQPERCPKSELVRDNLKVRIRSNGFLAKLKCRRGFTMVGGDPHLTCVRNIWRGQVPKCIAGGCEIPSSIRNGEETYYYNNAMVRFSCHPGYEIVGSPALSCDGTNWNDTMPQCVGGATPDLSCDFEDASICGWTNDPKMDFDWIRSSGLGATTLIGIAPRKDHTLDSERGHFMYIDSSIQRHPRAKARLYSPVYSSQMTSNGNTCFAFYYHMYGHTTGTLNVYLKDESTHVDHTSPMLQTSGFNPDHWTFQLMHISPMLHDFQIVFEIEYSDGPMVDVGIDDVLLAQGDECTHLEHQQSGTTEEFTTSGTTTVQTSPTIETTTSATTETTTSATTPKTTTTINTTTRSTAAATTTQVSTTNTPEPVPEATTTTNTPITTIATTTTMRTTTWTTAQTTPTTTAKTTPTTTAKTTPTTTWTTAKTTPTTTWTTAKTSPARTRTTTPATSSTEATPVTTTAETQSLTTTEEASPLPETLPHSTSLKTTTTATTATPLPTTTSVTTTTTAATTAIVKVTTTIPEFTKRTTDGGTTTSSSGTDATTEETTSSPQKEATSSQATQGPTAFTTSSSSSSPFFSTSSLPTASPPSAPKNQSSNNATANLPVPQGAAVGGGGSGMPSIAIAIISFVVVAAVLAVIVSVSVYVWRIRRQEKLPEDSEIRFLARDEVQMDGAVFSLGTRAPPRSTAA